MPKRKAAKEQTPPADLEWFRKRADERHTSLAEISRQIMGHKDLLGRALVAPSGQKPRKLAPAELVKLAELLRVPLAVIFHRLGYQVPGAVCSLVGIVDSSARVLPLPDDYPATAPVPSETEVSLVAVQVDAPNSPLARYQGTFLFYTPSDRVELDALGKLSVISLAKDTTPIVGFLNAGRVVVWGTNEVIVRQQLVAATPIRWQKAG